ncbi:MULTISPECIES: glycosyltransferase family 2 protein [Flavobacteriaceae]|uniref:glycosyltransferase family 2 protein n=1 Tax=Flavobacteriaceae TaxID=49546 RepID=UPI003A92C327
MSSPILVTVVIPNYNHEAFLKQRIESVLNQSFQDFELYILDDCSTDNSLQVINNYKSHPKVQGIIKNKKNAGSLFKQWIKAINLAKGKYLWIAESDDFAHIDFLKETVALAEQNNNLGFVFTDSYIVNASGKIIDQASHLNKTLSAFQRLQNHKIKDRDKVLDYFVSNLIVWNASSVLFVTESITKINFNILKSLKNAGDLFSYISIALEKDVFYLDKPLNYFRSHATNTTAKNIASGALFKDRLIIIQYFLEDLYSLNPASTHLKNYLRRSFLTAVDFKLYTNVKSLLRAYLKYNLISFYAYLNLSIYVCYFKIFKKVPYRYRSYIKKVLQKKIK